ncbi:hypothetical protein [Rhizobium azibense]|uniref:SIR2-like protein n=1 Tax=Rhizobium azibense TaxID=1136135 RepID=A0A4R3RVE6_9HYPH|nr:hypothetical protein [Rhizobium azibense]TCU38757.1 hypothetical protein EV129_104364 [Rhizobium azibense]
MFEQRTVFIVGAGASREINFPTGAELTGIIANKVHIAFSNGWEPTSGDKRVIGAIQHHLNQKGERDGNPYYHAGRAIASGMAQAISIDNYLHAHAEEDIITWVGKLGIAASILEAEKRSTLAPDRDRETVDLSAVSNSWYTPFFQMLTEGIQRTALDGIFDNVAFITFNYDRCIEHYLMHAIANYFRIDHREAQALVHQLRIEHPYGQVGRLPWQNPRGSTAFGKDFHGQELPEIAAQIRTFTERIEDGDMLARTRRLISEAEVVVYLGFSYGDMNMELLSVDQAGERSIFGTSLGISAPNKKVIERDIINSMGPDRNAVKSVELADMTCADFLRAYWKPIIRWM